MQLLKYIKTCRYLVKVFPKKMCLYTKPLTEIPNELEYNNEYNYDICIYG
jgi:hypothetical protein